MNTLVLIVFILLAYRYICYMREKNLSLKYKHEIFRLRDKVRLHAINGDIDNDDFFMMFDAMLSRLVKNADDFNIYYLALRNIYILRPTEEEIEDHHQKVLARIFKDEIYKDIYKLSQEHFYEYLAKKHFLMFGFVTVVTKVSKTIQSFIRSIKEKIWYDTSNFDNLEYDYVMSS